MVEFKINCLDHIAIRVTDLELSSKWYQDVLGLKQYKFKEWGPYPLFLLCGKTGLALFPKAFDDTRKPDHFAFNVDFDDFKNAQEHLEGLGIKYSFQDHHFFHSIYFSDPDDHTVELTCIVVDADSFYHNKN